MTIAVPHFFDANAMAWRPHPRFPPVITKSLETRESHPAASVTLVQVGAGGVVDTHTHDIETETAFVITGRGRLTFGDDERMLEAGTGVTIPPGIPHSLRNTEAQPMEILAIHIPPAF